MSIKKFTDWQSWWIGLRQNLLKCIGSTGVTWLGTSALSGVGVPISVITWKQAIAMFGVHIGFEVFSYLKDNQPKVITEEVNTTFQSKSPDGSQVVQSSKTTTTTPVDPKL